MKEAKDSYKLVNKIESPGAKYYGELKEDAKKLFDEAFEIIKSETTTLLPKKK